MMYECSYRGENCRISHWEPAFNFPFRVFTNIDRHSTNCDKKCSLDIEESIGIANPRRRRINMQQIAEIRTYSFRLILSLFFSKIYKNTHQDDLFSRGYTESLGTAVSK